nr:hypothetical protein B0A51_10498 [Rachicladosporium sp. CCFEE 5018]
MAAPAAIVIPALKRHTSTVIVAHGLGDSGAGWTFLAHHFTSRQKFPETKWIFPSAPSIPITINMGTRMPGWYDITSFEDLASRSEDEPGILRSQSYFHELIDKEVEAGIPSERVVLGGFSQGGAMALLSGITSERKLGGVFGLSCYMLLREKLEGMVPKSKPNAGTPIFMGHGDADQVVRYVWGQQTAAKLKDLGYGVEFKTYPGLPHSAAPEELDDLEKYLSARIPDVGEKKL